MRRRMTLSADPQAKCYMAGVPRATYTPGPFQIFQSAGMVIIVYQNLHTYRYIPTAPRPQIDGADFWLGSSRGHWERDTLVVDSISFNDQTLIKPVTSIATTLGGPKTLQYEARIEDPKVFTRPWSMRMIAERHSEPGFRIIEDECIRNPGGVLEPTAQVAK